MYYVIVFAAFIVVIGILIVLRTLAGNVQYDESEQLEQSIDTRLTPVKSTNE